MSGRKRRSVAAATFVGVAMLALAACGSSGSTAASDTKAPGATGATTTTVAPTSAPTGSPVVMTASNAKFGTILVDSAGKTLYTLTDAGGQAVACTGVCTTAWPPLLLPSGVTSATGASGVTGLGTTAGSSGAQVTENGIPLYRFAGDPSAGTANGDGVSSFGGTWHVVKASGASDGTTVTTAAPAPTDAPTTTSGYGY